MPDVRTRPTRLRSAQSRGRHTAAPFASNHRDQQQLGMLALHILQAALVYVNTLTIQDVLATPEWAGVLTDEDIRGL